MLGFLTPRARFSETIRLTGRGRGDFFDITLELQEADGEVVAAMELTGDIDDGGSAGSMDGAGFV